MIVIVETHGIFCNEIIETSDADFLTYRTAWHLFFWVLIFLESVFSMTVRIAQYKSPRENILPVFEKKYGEAPVGISKMQSGSK